MITPEQAKTFLVALAETGLIGEAARRAGVPRRRFLALRKSDAAFDEAYDEALEEYKDTLVKEVHRRGHDGYDKPVFQQGGQVGVIREYSDRLLEILVRRHLPEFREKLQVDANLSGGVLVVGGTPAEEEWIKRFGGTDAGTRDG